MAAAPGTAVPPSRGSGQPQRSPARAPTAPREPGARRTGTGRTGRRTVVGDVTLACLPVLPADPLHLAAPASTAQVAVVLTGCVAVRGTRGPLMPVGRGGGAASAGALTIAVGDPSVVLLLRFPLDALSHRGVRLSATTARTFEEGPLLGPLREFAYALYRSPPPFSEQAGRAAERSLVELLVGALLEAEAPGMDSEALRGVLRSRATAIVRHRFTDPSLRPRSVALELNVSLRHLQRCFEGSGTTIALEIRRARIEYAAALIDTPSGPERTDRRIAALAGFSSVGQLRAAFDDHFGMPTSRYRMLAAGRALLPSA